MFFSSSSPVTMSPFFHRRFSPSPGLYLHFWKVFSLLSLSSFAKEWEKKVNCVYRIGIYVEENKADVNKATAVGAGNLVEMQITHLITDEQSEL